MRKVFIYLLALIVVFPSSLLFTSDVGAGKTNKSVQSVAKKVEKKGVSKNRKSCSEIVCTYNSYVYKLKSNEKFIYNKRLSNGLSFYGIETQKLSQRDCTGIKYNNLDAYNLQNKLKISYENIECKLIIN